MAFGDDLENLFQQDGKNVFMLKLGYWITP